MTGNKYTERTVLNKTYDDISKAIQTNVVNCEVKVPTDVQDHWVEAVTLLASGARTASGNGSDIDVGRFIMGELCINVTAVTGTFAAGEGLQVIVEGKDEVTGLYKTIYDSNESLGGPITAVTTDWMTINMLAFRLIRVRWVISGTTPSFTFSVTLTAKA